MTTLREAATQALEALELGYDSAKAEADQYHAAMAGYRPQRHAQMDADVQQIATAITALKAALVEDAMQKFTDVNQDLMAALGCEHCNHPLYAATRCRVCGRVTEPVQEPVAWLFTNLQSGDYDFCYQEDEHDHDREMWHKQPLYTAPPQRKPLTEGDMYIVEEEAMKNFHLSQSGPRGHTITYWDSPTPWLIRAVERAHGITS